MASAREVIDRHVAAFGAKDPDAEPWSEDAEMVTPAGRFEGRDQTGSRGRCSAGRARGCARRLSEVVGSHHAAGHDVGQAEAAALADRV